MKAYVLMFIIPAWGEIKAQPNYALCIKDLHYALNEVF